MKKGQPRSQGSLLPVPAERETGQLGEDPGNEVDMHPYFACMFPYAALKLFHWITKSNIRIHSNAFLLSVLKTIFRKNVT